jgi:hypothetical protein
MNRPFPSSDELALFREEFHAIQGNAPFPWQERLFQGHFLAGQLPTLVLDSCAAVRVMAPRRSLAGHCRTAAASKTSRANRVGHAWDGV